MKKPTRCDENNAPHEVELKRQPKCRPPLFIDLVHNNARSRCLAMVLFAFVTAIVTFYFTASVFETASFSTTRIQFATSPQLSASFGSKFDNFSVSISNQWGLGVSGVEVEITLYPIQAFPLKGQEGEGSAKIGRSVNCISYFLSKVNRFADDALLCDLMNVSGAVTGNTGVTDKDGLAWFRDLRVNFGPATSYALVATQQLAKNPADLNPSFVESTVTLLSPVTKIMAPSSQLPSSVSIGGASSTFTVTAEVHLSPPVATDDPVGNFFGLSAASAGTAPAPDPIEDFSFLKCALLSFPESGADSNAVVLSNNVAPVSQVSYVSGDSSSNNLLYSAKLSFPDVQMLGLIGDSTDHFLLLWCHSHGVVIGGPPPGLLSSLNAQEKAEQSPPHLAWPFRVASDVASVEVTLPNSTTTLVVAEGELLPSISVKILDSGGAPIVNKRCLMLASPSSAFDLNSSGGSTNAKSLLDAASSPSDASGVAVFSLARFTRDGEVMVYNVEVSCDGVPMTSVKQSAAPAAAASFFPVSVTSTVLGTDIIVEDNIAQWLPSQQQQDVYVGEPWPTTPTVRVFHKLTRAPLPGKRATIRPKLTAEQTAAGVQVVVSSRSIASKNSASGDNVVITFESIVIASITGLLPTSSAPINVSFEVVVDELPSKATITKTVFFPVTTSVTACSTLQLQSGGNLAALQYRVPSGVPLNLQLRALTAANTPASLAQVLLEVYEQDRKSAVAQKPLNALWKTSAPYSSGSSPSWNSSLETTNVGGQVSFNNYILSHFPGNDPAAAKNVNLFLSFRCANQPRNRTLLLPVVFYNRVRKVVVNNVVSSASLTATANIELDNSAAAVIGAAQVLPLYAHLKLMSQPRFVEDYFPAPQTPVATVNGAGGASIALSVAFPTRPSEGFFAFSVVVDGVEFTGALASLQILQTVSRMVVSQSAVLSSTSPRIGKAFATQPRVQVLSSSGAGVAGVPVYAELILPQTPPLPPRALYPFSNATDYDLGMLVNFPPVGATSGASTVPFAPVLSDANGFVSFSTLGCLGIVPSTAFHVRYSISPSLGVTDPTLLLSVSATATSVATNDLPAIQLVTLPNLYAIPGIPMSRELQSVAFAGGFPPLPLAGAVAVPVIHNNTATRALLLHEPDQYRSTDPTGLIKMTNYFFSEAIPLAYYKLAVRLPGGYESSPSTSITVTRSPFSAEIVSATPSNVLIGNGFEVAVFVKIPNGDGLPNVVVTAELESTNSSCLAFACGALETTSSTSVTNNTGHANFFLVINSGDSGEYSIRFVIQGAGSSVVDKLNGFANGVAQASFFADAGTSLAIEQLNSLPVQTAETQGAADTLTSSLQQAQSTPAFIQAKVTETQQQSSLVSIATSTAYKRLRSSTEVSATLNNLAVWNNVAAVLILTQPAIAISAGFAERLLFGVQPQIQVLSGSGAPIANKSVRVEAFPNQMELSHSDALTTDANGIAQFEDLGITNVVAGSYRLVFFVDGVPSPYTEYIVVGPQEVAQSTLVQILAAVVLLILSPLFFANIPYSPIFYFYIGFVVMVLVPVFSYEWVLVNVIENDNIFLRLHIAMIAFLWILTTILYVLLFTNQQWFRNKFYRMRVFDGEERMLNAYRYTKWLITTRRPQLSEAEWKAKMEQEKSESFMGRLEARLEKALPKHKKTIDKLFGDDDTINIYEIEEFQPPPLEVPKDIKPIYYPNKFLIVLSITFVLMIVATFLALSILWGIIGTLDQFKAFLPEPPKDIDAAEKQKINSEMQSAVIMGFNLIASSNERLSFLKNVESTISTFDIFKTWETAFVVINDLRDVVEGSGYFGICCGALAVIATWITLCLAVTRIMQKMRRGELRHMKPKTSLIVSDRYVGLHVMHFVITFLSVFFIAFLIALVISARQIILLVVVEFWYTILTSLISVVFTVIMEVLVVGQWWVYGLTIRLMYPYFMWTVAGVILSLVNGVVQTIVRWIKAIFSITVLFARLDLDMFPEVLLFLDTGYWAFYSMLFADEEYNNPIFLSACGVFMTDLILKREFDANVQTPIAEFGAGVIALPHLRNMARIHLRDRTGNYLCLHQPIIGDEDYPWDLYLHDAKSKRWRRAAARWRLTALLVMNPSLCQYRKHRYVEDEDAHELMKNMRPEQLREMDRKRRQSTIEDGSVNAEGGLMFNLIGRRKSSSANPSKSDNGSPFSPNQQQSEGPTGLYQKASNQAYSVMDKAKKASLEAKQAAFGMMQRSPFIPGSSSTPFTAFGSMRKNKEDAEELQDRDRSSAAGGGGNETAPLPEKTAPVAGSQPESDMEVKSFGSDL